MFMKLLLIVAGFMLLGLLMNYLVAQFSMCSECAKKGASGTVWDHLQSRADASGESSKEAIDDILSD